MANEFGIVKNKLTVPRVLGNTVPRTVLHIGIKLKLFGPSRVCQASKYGVDEPNLAFILYIQSSAPFADAVVPLLKYNFMCILHPAPPDGAVNEPNFHVVTAAVSIVGI